MKTIEINELANGEFTIKEFSETGGIFPMTTKKTAVECVARVAQLLNIKEVIKPQDYPEKVCIGEVE